MRKIDLPITLFLSLLGLMACSRDPGAENKPRPAITNEPAASVPTVATRNGDLSRLLGKIWRISNPTLGLAPGSIYIFLPNGTLLETSCVETYRIAAWSLDQKEPGVLRVVEDQRPAFTAKVGESTDNTLRLEQTLLLGNKERRDLTLTVVEQEFVCPDLPK